MNERLQQLAKQAGLDYMPDPDLLRFANLIVKECLDNCMAANDRDRIREYFGVAE